MENDTTKQTPQPVQPPNPRPSGQPMPFTDGKTIPDPRPSQTPQTLTEGKDPLKK